MLRKFINDPAGATQMFDNDELDLFIDNRDGDLNLAASDIWRVKAGRVSEWYLVNIDGAFMSRGEAFDHAIKMSETYAKSGGMTNVALTVAPSANEIQQTPEF